MTDTLIDTNVYTGRWPFRRLQGDEDAQALAAFLSDRGVTQAWTGSFDALLHKDIAGVNERLAADCAAQGAGILQPFGAVNPLLHGWENELDRCAGAHSMKGLRLHPNYHGYTLDNPAFRALLLAASELRLLVQIAVTLEDERMMHPLLQVPHVDLTPLTGMVEEFDGLHVVLLNAFRAAPLPLVKRLAATKRISFDISWIEGVEGIARVAKEIPAGCLLFGSFAPLFYFESAALKLVESPLDGTVRESIRHSSATALLQP